MCGKKSNRQGFSLIEILVVITIGALFVAVVIPNVSRFGSYYVREKFIAQCNALMLFAWQQALLTRSVCKVDWNLKARKVSLLLQKEGERDKSGHPLFVAMQTAYTKTTISIPEQIEIKQFFIEGFDEMTRSASKETAEMWYFIVPDGLAQAVTINFVDTKNVFENKPRQMSMVLNPFSAQFAVFDAFQKG